MYWFKCNEAVAYMHKNTLGVHEFYIIHLVNVRSFELMAALYCLRLLFPESGYGHIADYGRV